MLVLASGSPRRRQILSAVGLAFEVVPPRVEEVVLSGEGPSVMASRLARQKARDVAARVGGDRWVLGCDTVVGIEDRVLGKPTDEAEATEMLLLLSGRTHEVYSGYAVVGFGEEHAGVEETRVTIRSITPDEAAAYSATGEPLDKAGAYAIQGRGIVFITSVEGSHSNVMGLPIEALLPVLAARGITPGGLDDGKAAVIGP